MIRWRLLSLAFGALPLPASAHPVCRNADQVDSYLAESLETIIMAKCPVLSPGEVACEAARPALMELTSELSERGFLEGRELTASEIEEYCTVLDSVVARHSG